MSSPDESPGFDALEAPAATPGFSEISASSAAAFSSVPQPTIFQRNQTTMTALGVVAAYLVLAMTTGIVLLGIFPVILAFRAFQRKEQLAPLAVAAAAVAVIFALSGMAHH